VEQRIYVFLEVMAPGMSAMDCMKQVLSEHEGSTFSFSISDDLRTGRTLVSIEGDGPKKLPACFDLVLQAGEDQITIKPDFVEAEILAATADPIAPERDMPMNYDAFDMASVLVKDKMLAKTVSADVVQRLAAELLKYKPKAE
jgi:hypothetical protein